MSHPVFHPKFSVKSAFDGNVVDASDGRYATEKARHYPKSTGRCAVEQSNNSEIVRSSRHQVEARSGAHPVQREFRNTSTRLAEMQATPTQGVRWQVPPAPLRRDIQQLEEQPSKLDRDYWMSTNRVNQQADPVVQGSHHSRRSDSHHESPHRSHESHHSDEHHSHHRHESNAVPRQRPSDRALFQRMGVREIDGQKNLRNKDRVDNFGMDANTFTVTVPAAALDGDEFVIELPDEMQRQGIQVEEVRFGDLPIDTVRDTKGHFPLDAETISENRQYWKGKNVVANRFEAKASAPRSRPSFEPKNL